MATCTAFYELPSFIVESNHTVDLVLQLQKRFATSCTNKIISQSQERGLTGIRLTANSKKDIREMGTFVEGIISGLMWWKEGSL